MECKYCHNKFITKSSLNKHVKYAKYCISKRNIGISTSFECHGCTKKYTSKYALNIHTESCTDIIIQNYEGKLKELTEQLQNQKEQYEKRIDVLQDKLENVAIKAVSNNFEDETVIDIDNTLSESQFTVHDSESESNEESQDEYQLTPLEVGQ